MEGFGFRVWDAGLGCRPAAAPPPPGEGATAAGVAPGRSAYGSKSSVSIALIGTISRRIPASARANQGAKKDDLIPLGRSACEGEASTQFSTAVEKIRHA